MYIQCTVTVEQHSYEEVVDGINMAALDHDSVEDNPTCKGLYIFIRTCMCCA